MPLTEVGSLAVNGRPAAPGYRPRAGTSCMSPPCADRSRSRRPGSCWTSTSAPVARRLRLASVDTAYANDRDDDALIEQANAEQRVLLTQDRGLLRRRKLWLGGYVRGARPDEQFRDVLDRFAPPLAPWTRCTACNGLLSPARKADVEPLLRPGTRRTYQTFSRCANCGQVYWRGAHSKRLDLIVESAVQAAGG